MRYNDVAYVGYIIYSTSTSVTYKTYIVEDLLYVRGGVFYLIMLRESNDLGEQTKTFVAGK